MSEIIGTFMIFGFLLAVIYGGEILDIIHE